jgi:hypothetical protein
MCNIRSKQFKHFITIYFKKQPKLGTDILAGLVAVEILPAVTDSNLVDFCCFMYVDVLIILQVPDHQFWGETSPHRHLGGRRISAVQVCSSSPPRSLTIQISSRRLTAWCRLTLWVEAAVICSVSNRGSAIST